MKKKEIDKDIICGILFFILSIIILIGVGFFVMTNLESSFKNLPPPNATAEWKQILSHDEPPCGKWWEFWRGFGCQPIECVIDCDEINKEAGEIICKC
jgi:hypothetical protein